MYNSSRETALVAGSIDPNDLGFAEVDILHAYSSCSGIQFLHLADGIYSYVLNNSTEQNNSTERKNDQ